MRQFPFVEELLFFSFLETKVQFFERKLFLLAAPRAGTTPCISGHYGFQCNNFRAKNQFLELVDTPCTIFVTDANVNAMKERKSIILKKLHESHINCDFSALCSLLGKWQNRGFNTKARNDEQYCWSHNKKEVSWPSRLFPVTFEGLFRRSLFRCWLRGQRRGPVFPETSHNCAKS